VFAGSWLGAHPQRGLYILLHASRTSATVAAPTRPALLSN
jgi:hypothetical protein